MEIKAWTVSKSGEVTYTLKTTGEDNFVLDLYNISKARYEAAMQAQKIAAYILEVSV